MAKKKEIVTKSAKLKTDAHKVLPLLAEKYSKKLGVTVTMIDAASMAIVQMDKQLAGELK